jgi:hypothetical protein
MRRQTGTARPRNPAPLKGTFVTKSQKAPAEVFLNIPYDQKFEPLFLAYIAGISAFGLLPRATLEIPSSSRRLDRILKLIGDCRYSIHDLSRVELDSRAPRTPRFNMPFELGLSVAYEKAQKRTNHDWYVCESLKFRLAKSLSDLNGTDPFVHDGTIAGIFRELGNIFWKPGSQPSIQQMWRIYRAVRESLPTVLREAGTRSLYTARVFKELCVIASSVAHSRMRSNPPT